MKIIKQIITLLLGLLLLGLLIAPVGIMYRISQGEQAQYQSVPVPNVPDMAYGQVVQVQRRDMTEAITLRGRVVCASDFYLELKTRNPYDLRFVVQVGDVLHPGDLIAYDKGKEILSEAYGLIQAINLGSDPYILLGNLDDLAVECQAGDVERAVLQRSTLNLADGDGCPLTVSWMDEIYRDGNTTRVLLRYEKPGLCYGKNLPEMVLTTGKVYSQALTVDQRCIYQKEPDGPWFVRLVTGDGQFLLEQEVKLGYSDGTYVCISGVEDGAFCDSGYNVLVGERYGGT